MVLWGRGWCWVRGCLRRSPYTFWTQAKANEMLWREEETDRHRRECNERVKDHLLKGDTVIFRIKGEFLHPRVCSGDRFTFDPIKDHCEINVGDIVFCEIGNSFYAHLIKAIGDWKGRRCFTIANTEGWEYGWCSDKQVYGRLTHVERQR